MVLVPMASPPMSLPFCLLEGAGIGMGMPHKMLLPMRHLWMFSVLIVKEILLCRAGVKRGEGRGSAVVATLHRLSERPDKALSPKAGPWPLAKPSL